MFHVDADAPPPDAAPARTTSCDEGSLRLDIRPAVALRRVGAKGYALFYLTLFEDEVELRLAEFLAPARPSMWTVTSLTAAALRLEPTDAVVVADAHGDILVARGGAANFPLYWRTAAGKLVLSTVLPIDRERCVSRAGLLSSLIVATVANQNEPNVSLRTPAHGWFRCRRGAVSRLSPDGLVSDHPVDLAEFEHEPETREELIAALRLAGDVFGRRQQSRRRALVELSGGYDSTIAAISVRASGVDLLGVSNHFPYYEFRFEEELQMAVATSLGIARLRLDGTHLLAFAPSEWWPRLDEPAIAVIGLKRAVAIARVAAANGLDRIFVGHGGDQLFAEDVLARETTMRGLDRRAFTKTTWHEVERVQANVAASPFLQRSSLVFSYDARFDAVFKEVYGTTTRSPFTDLAWIRCGLSWARLTARHDIPLNKRILTEAFDLPQAVTHRRGKVPWDGVNTRGYARYAGSIITEIERVREPLERLGVEVRWLVKQVTLLADGRRSTSDREDREVIAIYALATWLHSWGIDRATDCHWAD